MTRKSIGIKFNVVSFLLRQSYVGQYAAENIAESMYSLKKYTFRNLSPMKSGVLLRCAVHAL